MDKIADATASFSSLYLSGGGSVGRGRLHVRRGMRNLLVFSVVVGCYTTAAKLLPFRWKYIAPPMDGEVITTHTKFLHFRLDLLSGQTTKPCSKRCRNTMKEVHHLFNRGRRQEAVNELLQKQGAFPSPRLRKRPSGARRFSFTPALLPPSRAGPDNAEPDLWWSLTIFYLLWTDQVVNAYSLNIIVPKPTTNVRCLQRFYRCVNCRPDEVIIGFKGSERFNKIAVLS